MTLLTKPVQQKFIDTLPSGFLMLKTNGCFAYVNKHYLEMSGYEENKFLTLNIHDIEYGKNQYMPHAFKMLNEVDGKAFESCYESKHKGANGTMIAVSVKASYDPDISADVLLFIREINTSQNSLNDTNIVDKIFSHSSEGIFITDQRGIIQRVNKAFTQISGYALEDVIGKPTAILNSGKQDHHFYQHFWQALTTSGTWAGEIWNKRKNGEIFPEWLNINGVTDNKGKTSHYIGQFIEISDVKNNQNKQPFQLYHDPLTQLPNRRFLFEHLEKLCNHNNKHQQAFAVIFCDLDRFKSINDTQGQATGDAVLKAVAAKIQQNLHANDVVARSGGNEFIIFINELQDANHLKVMVKKLFAAFQEPLNTLQGTFHLSCSMGVSNYPEDTINVRELISFADIAMAKVKSSGGSGYSYFDEKKKNEVRQKATLEHSLHTALEKQQFELWYQPQMNNKTQQVYGIECLLRWRHPQLGLIAPSLFIPIAEETGLIKKVGAWVINTACKQLKKWQKSNIFNGVMAINVSLRQFENNDLLTQIESTLLNESIAGNTLEIEVTESVFSSNDTINIDILNRLRALDVNIAIDDFGTGYSSLSRLKKLPVDNLKIDKSFVEHITTTPEDVAIIKAAMLMANAFKLEVIAEGVETIEQGNLLTSLGCYNHQGYLYCQPLPAYELEQWLISYQQKQLSA